MLALNTSCHWLSFAWVLKALANVFFLELLDHGYTAIALAAISHILANRTHGTHLAESSIPFIIYDICKTRCFLRRKTRVFYDAHPYLRNMVFRGGGYAILKALWDAEHSSDYRALA